MSLCFIQYFFVKGKSLYTFRHLTKHFFMKNGKWHRYKLYKKFKTINIIKSTDIIYDRKFV